MVRTLKLLQCLLLSVVILSAEAKRADAFFLLPPMPWDIEIDIPGNANKIVSNLKAYYRQLQTIHSELNTQKLEVLKKGQVFNDFKKFIKIKEGGKNKAPGKGQLVNNAELGINTGGLDEEENYNAFHTLFFVYPPKSAYAGSYPVVKTAYRNKALEYQQDVVMETYLVGRVTEDYLSLVDKTIERLDRCQKGIYTKDEMPEKCVFFGLQMAYVEPQKAEPEGNPEKSDNPGQYGEMMNAYIVTTVYDRLMRIVEDLTAAEAQFRSALQIDFVDPIEPDETSSAEDYTDKGFRFAYNDSYSYAQAKMLGGKYKRSTACKNGSTSPDCAGMNEDKAEIENVDETDILGKLQPVDELISQAMVLHNLKSQLGEYKSQYRKYLKAQEIHDRMMRVLQTADQCAVGFLTRHGANGSSIWYGDSVPVEINDYDSRAGLSRELIKEYQKSTTDTIIGTDSNNCDGFYESCPEGYRLDEKNPCEYVNEKGETVTSKTMFACVVDTVTADTDVDFEPKLAEDYASEGAKNTRTYNDTDYLIDGTKANDIETENRVKAEKSWRIGYNAIMEMTEDGTLKFNPWNDQKNLQSEYLRNKYRNMKMIVKAVDKGKASYMIGSTIANSDTTPSPAEPVLAAVTRCKTPTNAVADGSAYQVGCIGYPKSVGTSWQETEYYTSTCTDSEGNDYSCTKSRIVTKNDSVTLNCKVKARDGNNTGWIDVQKEEYISGTKNSTRWVDADPIDQRINNCVITKAPTPFATLQAMGNSAGCPGVWDFTVSFLVKKYFPAVLAECSGGGLEAEATHVYNRGKGTGRIVASDRFDEVLAARKEVEATLKALVLKYESDMKSLKAQLKSTIEARKSHSQRISEATDIKNEAIQQRERSLRRITAITNQINDLENNRIPALDERLNGRDPKPESLQKDKDSLLIGAGDDLKKFDKPTLAQKIGIIPALKVELQFIQTGKSDYDPYENIEDETKIFKDIPSQEAIIASSNTVIDSAQSILDALQAQIDSLQKQIEDRAAQFAEDYLDAATKGQEKIEEANKKFEDMVETKDNGSEPSRMINTQRKHCCKHVLGICMGNCQNEYPEDNLASTIVNVLYEGELPPVVKQNLEEKWFNGKMGQYASMLSKADVPGVFVVAGGALSSYGVAAGQYTPAKLADALKDKTVEIASGVIVADISKSDEIIAEEIAAAAEEIDAIAKKWGVTGEDNVEADPAIYIHANYAKDGEAGNQAVTGAHMQLIADLREPTTANAAILHESGIDLSVIFGIPGEIVTDSDFFAGLPARGLYIDKQFDSNDGRDYMAPHRPLLNLAPVREVFYYSPLDYDDTPKDKKGKKDKQYTPARSYLIDVKYKGTEYSTDNYMGKNLTVEYLPETWRYLLAQPNMREDGKYQQTFVERSFGTDKLKKYLNNEKIAGADVKHYRTIIGRAGVYPCKLGAKVIDMAGGDGVNNMSFQGRSSLPFGVNSENCQEVAAYKNGIRHLLADHDAKDVKKSKALQTSLGSQSEPMYINYSELGQLLQGNLQFRPLIQNINEYLLDNKNQENSITRQHAETATYRRNVLGSFLEAVNGEHNAKKTLDNNREDVMKSLENLCAQLHKYGESVNGETCADANDSTCADEINTQCAEYIEANGGLAKSSADDDYEPKCVTSGGASGSYYDQIFCQLDAWKDEKLAEARAKFAEVEQQKFPEKVEERIQEIKDYFGAFAADPDEESYIQPNATQAKVEEAVKEAHANREASRAAENEGITSMDNQSQAVAYCPVY